MDRKTEEGPTQQQQPQKHRITVAIEALGQAELHDLGWALPATSDLRINRLIRSQQQSPDQVQVQNVKRAEVDSPKDIELGVSSGTNKTTR